MITAIIIDDEKHCIGVLADLLKNYCSNTIQLVSSYLSIEEGIKGIHKFQPGLLFLDVEINDKTGFDLLKQLPEINFEVIFTTAYDKYAVKAFKFSAIDYLLKPINADELISAVTKLKEKVEQKQTSQKLDALFHNLKNIQGVSKKIGVGFDGGIEFLEVTDIIYCESSGNYTNLFTKDKKKMLVTKSLKDFEDLLTDYNFFRIHNSYLINLTYIKNYSSRQGSSVIMSDGSEIGVATRRKDEFLKRMHAK